MKSIMAKCVLVLCTALAVSVYGDLLNPGFSASGGAGSTPDNWIGSGKEGAQNEWGSHDGDGWLMAFNGYGAGTSGQLYQDVVVSAGQQYALDFWQESDAGWNGTAFSASLRWLNGDDNEIGTAAVMDLQPWTTSGGWVNHVLSGTAPIGTVEVRVQFDATSLNEGSGAGKLDDLSLDAIPEPGMAALVLTGLGLLVSRRLRKRM